MVVSYQVGLVICIVLAAVGLTVGTMALINSVKEVRLLRNLGIQSLGEEEEIVGSAGSSILGAVLAGIGSATLVGLYGVGGQFWYLGPIAAIVSAGGVIACFVQDIVDEKRIERLYERTADKQRGN